MFIKRLLIFISGTIFFVFPGLACDRQYIYSTEVTSTPTAKPTQHGLSTFKSVLTVKAVSFLGKKNWWGIKADQVVMKINGQRIDSHDYEIPFAFRLDKSGMIEKFWYPDSLSYQQKEKLSGLAYYFQYSRSKESHFVSEENEHQQVYRYQYQKGAHLTKQKLAVISTLPDSLTNIIIHHSAITIDPDNCLLNSSQGVEKLEFQSVIPVFNSHLDSKFNLVINPSPILSPLLNLPDDISLWPTYQKVILSDKEKKRQIEALNTFVNELDPNKISVFEAVDQLAKFKEVLSTLLPLFKKNSFPDLANMRLINAIGLLDISESQVLLTNMISSLDLNADVRFRALQALTSGSNSLSKDSVPLIEKLITDGIETKDKILLNSLLPTLGIALGNRPLTEESETLRNALADKLDVVTENKEKAQLIMALGNAKSYQHADTIIRYSNDSSSLVRRDTAYALGKLKTPEAYRALGDMLVKEPIPSSAVEFQVLNSLSNFNLKNNELNLITNIADNSNNQKIRSEAIKAISTQPKETKIPLLKKLLKTESDTETFQQIINEIHSHDTEVVNQ
jgi:HEAT repeat protein